MSRICVAWKMTCRPLLLELQLRTGTICRACCSSLGRQLPATQQVASYSTQSSALRRRGRVPRRDSRPKPKSEDPDGSEAAMRQIMQRAQLDATSQPTSDQPTVRYFEQGEDSKFRSVRDGDEFDR